MYKLIQELTQEQLRSDLPSFRPGDTVRVHVKVIEGTRERIQVFEGVVISVKGSGLSRMITVRKISHGVGVEKILPINSPLIKKIEIVKRGNVRRSKLYYLRERSGKAARLKEKRVERRLAKKAKAEPEPSEPTEPGDTVEPDEATE